MRKLVLNFLIIIVTSVVTAGCTNFPVGKKENVLVVTPVELFTGNEQKYRALIPYATAYKLDYKGEEREIIISTSIWDGGEIVNELGRINARLASDNSHINLENSEMILSIERISIVDEEALLSDNNC